MSVFALKAFADQGDTAAISAASDVQRADVHTYQILGTWQGAITFEVKGRSTETYVDMLATNVSTGVDAVTATANGIYRFLADGLDSRARFSNDQGGAPQVWRTQRKI